MSILISALLAAGMVVLMHLTGRLAERRGRSFKTWAAIAGVIGPLALPLVMLFSNRQAGRR